MATNRSAIQSFAKRFKYDNNNSPQSITKQQLLHSSVFLDSMPNEYLFYDSIHNTDDIFNLFNNYHEFVYSSQIISKELESSLFPFFCYLYINDYRDSTDSNIEENIKSTIIPKLPEESQHKAVLFLDNAEFHEQFKLLLISEKYIIKCSKSIIDSLTLFLNDPKNAQLRSVFTSLFILDENSILSYQNYAPMNFHHDSCKINILKAELPNSQFATFSTSTTRLFYVSNDNSVNEIDLSHHHSQQLYLHKMPISTISPSSTSQVIFTGDIGGSAQLWSNKTLVKLPQSTMPIWSSDFAPKGGVFAFGSSDSIIRLFDTPNQKPIRYLCGHKSSVIDIKFHPNCFLISSTAMDSTVRVWDPRESKTVRLWISKIDSPLKPTFSWDGKMIAFLEYPNTIVVGEIATSKEIHRRAINEVHIYSIHFALDDQSIYIITRKGEILNLPIFKEEKQIRLIKELNQSPISSSLSSSGDLCVVTSKR